VGLQVHPCERTGRPEGLYCLWRWTRSPAGLSWCMCVCVRGVKEDLGAGLFFSSVDSDFVGGNDESSLIS